MEIESKVNPERPVLLKVLCILTFIGSGLSFLSNASVYVFFDWFKDLFLNHSDMIWMGSKMDFSSLFQINRFYFLLSAILFLLSLVGAMYMWKLNKVGFHLYTLAQIALLIIPKFFIPSYPFPLFPILFSGLFVYLYYSHLRWMH